MPLPSNFRWTTRSASRPDDPLTVIACEGVCVVSLFQRVNDNIWIAYLDRQRHGPGVGPIRACSSYGQGRIGAETWVARHEARLRADVEQITAWRSLVRANRLARGMLPPPFAWME